MAIEPEEVRHVASLARLGVTEAELPRLAHDLSRILEHVGRLSDVQGEKEVRAPSSPSRRPDQPRPTETGGPGEETAAQLISRSSGSHRSEDGAHMVAVPTVVEKDNP
jgi:aspartyl/glutamyl-tRNA(Asn/Gln) amidotransferase C subunit